MIAGGPSQMPAWRNKLQAGMFMAVGLAGVIAGIALVGFQVHNNSRLSSYRSAALCASATDAVTSTGCRYAGRATVTKRYDPKALSAEIVFEALPVRKFPVKFTAINQPDSTTGAVGASVTAELWDRQVTSFAGSMTADNPNNIPPDMTFSGVVFGVVGLGVTAFAVMLVRVAWRKPGQRAAE